MADMDTYDDQRGYEGNYTTSNANAYYTRDTNYGYYGRREFDNQLDQTSYHACHTSRGAYRRSGGQRLTLTTADERDYPPRERSRSPGPDRDGDTRIRDEPMNGRADR